MYSVYVIQVHIYGLDHKKHIKKQIYKHTRARIHVQQFHAHLKTLAHAPTYIHTCTITCF